MVEPVLVLQHERRPQHGLVGERADRGRDRLVRHEGQEAAHGHELAPSLELLGDRHHELHRHSGDDRRHPARVEMDRDVGKEAGGRCLATSTALPGSAPPAARAQSTGPERPLGDGGDQPGRDQLGDRRGAGQAGRAGEEAVGRLGPEVTQIGGRYVGEVGEVGLVDVEQAGDLEDLRAYVEAFAHPISALRTPAAAPAAGIRARSRSPRRPRRELRMALLGQARGQVGDPFGRQRRDAGWHVGAQLALEVGQRVGHVRRLVGPIRVGARRIRSDCDPVHPHRKAPDEAARAGGAPASPSSSPSSPSSSRWAARRTPP